jgi:putative sugar O-methyltransferase
VSEAVSPSAPRRSVSDEALTLEAPSHFWRELGAEHARDLTTFGIEHVKRHQALRYFTWRWRFSTLRGSQQFRFLLRNVSPATVAACAAEPVDLSDGAWRGVDWPRHERWLYTFAARLVWEYARRHDALGITRLDEPTLGDPLPVRRRRRLISQDLANSALEASAVARALAREEPASILEIGAGYGRLGHALLSAFPGATYTVVDIEPARTVSEWYLTRLFPTRRVRFLTPAQAAELPSGSISLALSVSSLQEMTPEQVASYLRLLDRLAAGGLVYLKQWAEWRNPVDGVTLRFDDYPVPARWEACFDEPAPVQTRFRQAAWRVPGGDAP